ncbi:MAG: ABC transporter ATP-binding protein [Bacillota bacterium]|nr:ABC transporter ATP-binding protein [Bacillota bacterium]
MIDIKGMKKSFTLGDETITAVNDVDLHVDRGDFLAVIGPSGSGKSTLMNILGLLDKADEGTYSFDGIDVTDLSDNQQAKIRNEKIGFVFQSFYLLQKLTAVENVMVPLLYRGVSDKEARKKAEAMLQRLGLGERQKHMPQQLSGGQQQRVAIARALVGEPELILADEPTGALDQTTGREILKLLQDLNEEGQTIIIITHDNFIAHQAKRIYRMEDGILREEEAE